MKNVPHWQLLMIIYFIAIGVPVMMVHSYSKTKLLENKTTRNLLLYFIAVVGTAFLMHFLYMLVYFKFFFKR
jgi:predicted permease